MHDRNLAVAVFHRALAQGEARAFELPQVTLSYRMVADLMVHFATRMQQHGVDRRSTVGLAIREPSTAAIAAAAVALIGCEWVAISNPAAVAPACSHILAAGPQLQGPGRIPIDQSWFAAAPATLADLERLPGHNHPDDFWMIAHSSGTTGKPKFMPITYAGVWRRIGNPELQDGRPPVTCNLFPATSYVGAKINIGNLVLGGTNVVPAEWDVLLHKGVNRIMGSPAQIAAAIFNRTSKPRARIRSLKVTGARVTQHFVATALRYFEEVHILYAATEMGTTTLARITDLSQFDGSSGLPFDGAEVQAVDAANRPLPRGSEGIIRARSEWMVEGYINEPEITAEFFKEGWFYPGDLGIIDARGALHITGRVGDVINTGGRKLNAAELDEIVQAHPDVADGYCFVGQDGHGMDALAVVVALRQGGGPEGLASLVEAATARLGKSKAPQLIYLAERVPRNDNGKALRSVAAESTGRFQLVWPRPQ